MTLDEAIKENKKDLKKLIQKYEKELNNNDFSVIYNSIDMQYLVPPPAFTALLLKNNINPLIYMNYIPAGFAYNLDIEKIVIPNSIIYICHDAFERCFNLTEIIIPYNVVSIDKFAFKDCISLTSITIPKNVKIIVSKAFFRCDRLKDVYYEGSEEDWKNIEIEDGNDDLLSANIHYNI